MIIFGNIEFSISNYTILTATKEKLDARMGEFGLKNSYPQTSFIGFSEAFWISKLFH